MRTRSGQSSRAGKGGRGVRSAIIKRGASGAGFARAQAGSSAGSSGGRGVASKDKSVGGRAAGTSRGPSLGNRGNLDSDFEKEIERNFVNAIGLRGEENEDGREVEVDREVQTERTDRPVSIYRAPVRSDIVRSSSSDGGGSSGGSSGMFVTPREEPENPISFKAALEFLPKVFDGENMPVGRFVSDCLFARNSIASKDRHYLFLMVRSRVVGNAFDSLQDRDLHNLEDLLKHLKNTFTEHRSLSQLNTALATVAQREGESVLQYGSRVSKVLASLIELIEDKNNPEAARYMIKSARDTACENFIMGLRQDLVWRVRVGRPATLQEAINNAKQAEWEVGFEGGLDRKRVEKKGDQNVKFDEAGRNKGYFNSNTRGRFRPYYSDARARKCEVGRGRGRGGARGGGTGREPSKGESSRLTEISCHKCGEPGHLARGCVRTVSFDGRRCFNCNQSGHFLRDCRYPPKNSPECFICGKTNHFARDCPEKEKDSHVKNNLNCNFCKKSGHSYEKCFKRLNLVAANRENKGDNLNEK